MFFPFIVSMSITIMTLLFNKADLLIRLLSHTFILLMSIPSKEYYLHETLSPLLNVYPNAKLLNVYAEKKNDCLLFSIDALNRTENISHVNLADSRDQPLYSQ